MILKKTDRDIDVIAYHGWGFQAGFWDPLKQTLDGSVRFRTADRGYFSEEHSPVFSEKRDRFNVVFAHSFGLHWCPGEVLSRADHLVVFGGFLGFHPSESARQRKSKLVLRQMLTQFVEDPQAVLNRFYQNCFFPEKPIASVPEEMNHDLLLSDLSRIDEDMQDRQRIFEKPSLTILQGTRDKIVDKAIARKMYHQLRYRSQYFEIMKSGHALPATHPDKCADIFHTVIEEVRIAQ